VPKIIGLKPKIIGLEIIELKIIELKIIMPKIESKSNYLKLGGTSQP
jgi:hypothetical protein